MIGIVDLSGGFGNHLFLYSLGLYLKKNGIKVYFYNPEKKYYIDPSLFNFRKLENIKYSSLEIYKKLNKIHKNYKKISLDEVAKNNFNIEKIFLDKKIISFNGYFQNYLIVNENLEELKKILLDISKDYKINETDDTTNTMVHVRRSDYVNIGEQLDINYYKKAISYCQENIKNFNFNVFTDDYEWVKSQSIFKDANKIENSLDIEKRIEKNVLTTFFEMMNYKNFIISNSTFSWWSAILGSDNNSVVTCPEPFFRNEKSDLTLDKWVIFPRE